MKIFSCDVCGQRVYFENTQCTGCGSVLGFLPDTLHMASLQSCDNLLWHTPGGTAYRLCGNSREHGVCNWMIPAGAPGDFCPSCALNRTIPNLQNSENLELWRDIETAKRRLIYSLLRFGLDFSPGGPGCPGLAFEFLADTAPTFQDSGRVLTGHQNGLITLNIAEADPVLREKMREEMDEPYRTLLGHFRHESGHYFWERFQTRSGFTEAFREQFGDERQDYTQALQAHHQNGPPSDWRGRHVTAYAACHPWEDWAETWAHYLHIIDTLDTATHFGLRIRPRTGRQLPTDPPDDFDPYTHASFRDLTDHWFPLTHVMNSLNRSMGHEDAYPFVLSPVVLDKLHFIHAQILLKSKV
jgi:hypothetical protein